MPEYITTAPSTATHCTVDGCRQQGDLAVPDAGPRIAVPGTDMCTVHHARFARILKQLALTARLLKVAAYSKRPADPDAPKVRTSGIADVSAAWNPAATEALSSIADWTRYLVRMVQTEAPLPPAEERVWIRNRTVRDPHSGLVVRGAGRYTHRQVVEHHHAIDESTDTVLALAALARYYARWLSGYPSVGPDLLAEAVDHAQAAQRALNGPVVRRARVPGASCRESVLLGPLEVECGAEMFVLVDMDKPDSEAAGRMLCSQHPESHHVYEPHEWAEFFVPDPEEAAHGG